MDPFLGEIIMFAGNFAPRGWAFCEGQLLPISQYSALFSILGTTYGGDGRTTFGLPDLRSRVPVGEGTGPGLPNIRLGERGGNAQTTLVAANIPPMTVSIPASEDASSDSPSGLAPAALEEDSYGAPATGESMAKGRLDGAQQIPFSNMQPSLGMNYIIALQGTFPSRS